jgi:AraC-like DNA-binding protein
VEHATRDLESASAAPPRCEADGRQRTALVRSPLGLVESVASRGGSRPIGGFSPDFQVCLPYRGLFVFHVGDDDVVSDANQVVFVAAGEPFRLSEPRPGGYAELVVTLPPSLLAELVGASPAGLRRHPLFRLRRRRAEPRLQFLRSRLLHAHLADPLATDELLIAVLRSALAAEAPAASPGAATRRLIARTKEFVAGHLGEAFRLGDVARSVGASPAYLTDVFRRCEGLPLHRYTVQLRLARALDELPRAPDLTCLALDLGFSSHSHFTAAFRRAFDCTPSEFRESTRGRAVTAASARWRASTALAS